ncbi:MAG TPA: N-6 DNA methylase [Opitutaceae bacterium]|nr:N-6 DNA methylase [Opitutaceae bacterium]
MPLPDSIRDRIELFARNEEQYRDSGYKEAQLRQEFLDPLFAALGWDMDNKAGHAESYKDVVHEDAIKIGGETKAPDYSFRIGGTRKFFVEAKKPAVLIKDDPEPAYQLRRYSWSAKLPLGILTDFQEFAIYDTRVRPVFGDRAHTARLFYCTYRELPEKWDEIAGIFAKDSVLRGSFDKYAAATRGKRGTATVDIAFLEEIERWRDLLARHLALRNESLSQRDLNFAVQRLIDRLVFLRIAEDRGLEPFGQLQALTAGNHLYRRLCELFERADYRYNSGLFHFEKDSDCSESPDRLSLRLELDDAPLKDVLKNLYYPASPYVFSVIPADILGSVYERFLGKVIHLTEGHRARIEEKPEVRKAGGVYYTPTYIVDYIVRQTVGTLVAGKTPKQIEKLRVLDPACGSGSFLIGAYQFLLDWHLDHYLRNDPEKWAKQKPARLYQTNPNAAHIPPASRLSPLAPNWQLTTAERKRILLAHIHGVDIDPQAVEVTKLSLLLKVLEGEARETQGRTREMSAVLPDLGKNIKCGNSLVGHDFYAQPDLPTLDDEARLQLNTFDWAEGFPEIMRAGGFDAVIGNPPYVRQESIKEQKAYFETHFASFDGTADLFIYFIEQGLKLLRPGGRYSIIVSSSLLRAAYAEPLRRHVLGTAAVEQIVDFGGLAVFADAKDTYVCIPVLSKTAQPEKVQACRIRSLEFENLGAVTSREAYAIPASRLTTEAFSVKSDAEAAVFDKIVRSGTPLGQIVGKKFFRGILSGLTEAFEVSDEQKAAITKASPQCASLIKPFVGGQNVRRYYLEDEGRNLIVVPSGWTRAQMKSATAGDKEAWAWFAKAHPALAKHLAPFEVAARKRQDKGEFWWELRSCDYYADLDAPKIIFPDIAKSPRFFPDSAGTYLSNTAYCLGSGDRYLVAMLNSRLSWFAISNIAIPFGMRAGEFRYRLFYQYMEKVPIRQIDPKSKPDRERHDRLVALVDTMLALHAKLAAAQSPDVEENLRRQIAATDRAIDALVYALYGLTPEEIALVESATAPQSTAAQVDSPAASDAPPAPLYNDQAVADAAHFYGVKEDPPGKE